MVEVAEDRFVSHILRSEKRPTWSTLPKAWPNITICDQTKINAYICIYIYIRSLKNRPQDLLNWNPPGCCNIYRLKVNLWGLKELRSSTPPYLCYVRRKASFWKKFPRPNSVNFLVNYSFHIPVARRSRAMWGWSKLKKTSNSASNLCLPGG